MPTPWSPRLISLTAEINRSSDKRQWAGEARVSRIRKAKVSQLYCSRAWTAGRGALRITPRLSGTSNTGTRQSWRKKSCPWSVLSHTSRHARIQTSPSLTPSAARKDKAQDFRATAADKGETRRPEKASVSFNVSVSKPEPEPRSRILYEHMFPSSSQIPGLGTRQGHISLDLFLVSLPNL